MLWSIKPEAILCEPSNYTRINNMKVSILTFLSGFLVGVSALPQSYPRVDLAHTKNAPSPTTFDLAYLNRPMHTTALMAGEAMRLTQEAEAARTSGVESRVVESSEVDRQVELR